jgi:hypothetical protein
MPADADISCYYETVSGSNQLVGVKDDETCNANGYPSNSYNAAYIADVSSATTGTYELWTTGTDAQLDPCSVDGQACQLQESHHITIDIAVPGCGSSCQAFSDVSISGSTTGSNQAYTAAVGSCSATFDGAICSDISCSGDFQPSGNLKCVDGVIETTSCVWIPHSSIIAATPSTVALTAPPVTRTTETVAVAFATQVTLATIVVSWSQLQARLRAQLRAQPPAQRRAQRRAQLRAQLQAQLQAQLTTLSTQARRAIMDMVDLKSMTTALRQLVCQ